MLSSSLACSRGIKVTVNGNILEANKGETVMELCDRHNIQIPRLCHHPNLSPRASCRVCLVEFDKKWLGTACSNTVWEGLSIETNSPKVRNAVQKNLSQLMSSHDEECSTCVANKRCVFRDQVFNFQAEAPIRGHYNPERVDRSTNSIVLDVSKCVLCGRCVRACEEIAGQHALTFANRAHHMLVQPALGVELQETNCIKCGQCTLYCPVGAITEKSQYREVLNLLRSKSKPISVVQVAPAVRIAISEALGYPPGTIATGKLVAVLRKLGFDIVYDTNFSADLTIIEEANELVQRLSTPGSTLPMFTSCCPAWVNYVEQSHPELIPNLSSCKSPQGMLSSLIKNYPQATKGLKANEILNVSIMPCTAKKDEIERPQLRTKEGIKETDYVLTVRELADLILHSGINWNELEDSDFDILFGKASGAGAIFGATGGVMEAAVRTAFEKVTNHTLTNVNITPVRGFESSIKVCELDFDGTKVKVAVCHGINDTSEFLDRLKRGDTELKDIKFVEVMACPGGCVVGGGTSTPADKNTVQKRIDAIYRIDKTSPVRKSHENPLIQSLYKDFLGKPASHIAHDLLHTHYKCRVNK